MDEYLETTGTPEQMKAVASLNRIAAKWPKGIWIWSADAMLFVMQLDDNGERRMVDGAVDAAAIIGRIHIPADGGDW